MSMDGYTEEQLNLLGEADRILDAWETINADALMEERIKRVWEHADDHWKECVAHACEIAADRRRYVTSEEVWNVLKVVYPDASTHEHRAMGPAMRRARAGGLWLPTNFCRKIHYPGENSSPGNARVWRSLLA